MIDAIKVSEQWSVDWEGYNKHVKIIKVRPIGESLLNYYGKSKFISKYTHSRPPTVEQQSPKDACCSRNVWKNLFKQLRWNLFERKPCFIVSFYSIVLGVATTEYLHLLLIDYFLPITPHPRRKFAHTLSARASAIFPRKVIIILEMVIKIMHCEKQLPTTPNGNET